MKICFPVRKQNGSEYSSPDEMMASIGREPHGSWLAGTNCLWHGGIHVSTVSAPGSVLTPDNVATAVPLQCMAKGEAVAWRLNKNYLTADYNGNSVRYSSSFILVKSVCQPDPQKTRGRLEFYTLYLGLAPLSAFPKKQCMKAKANVVKHPCGKFEDSRPANDVATISPGTAILPKDTRVIILREAQFRNDSTTQKQRGAVAPFGLAKSLNASGAATGEAFWVTMLPELMAPDGELYTHLPEWMARAVQQGEFNSVAKPATKLDIAAGDAIGYLGEDIAPAGKSKVDSCHFAHIEVISIDPNVPAFLNNSAQVTCGQQYIQILAGKPLYHKTGEGKDSTFTPMSCVVLKDGGRVLPREKCDPIADQQGKTWFKIRPHSWLAQADVNELNQYDLKALGFTTLEQTPSPDVSKSLRENWVKGVYAWYCEQLGQSRGMRQLEVASFYQHLIKTIDANGDGNLSPEELYNAVHHPEMGIRDIAARLVVKHDSEWFGGSRHHRWNVFFQNYDLLSIAYAKQWLDDMEWMSQVEAFSSGDPVWHFHPVMFLRSLNAATELIDIDAFVSEYEKIHTTFALGTPALSHNSKNNLIKLLKNINDFYFSSTDFKPNLYKIAYMLATARHETLQFKTGEFFSETSEVGSENYFNKYDPILADDNAKRITAIKYGNTDKGDGFKYRGRGCVQLTWKNNYKKASIKFGIDFVSAPHLACDFRYSVPIMVWGMETGIFTGKSLKNYINKFKIDYIGSRYIINGQNEAVKIASYAEKMQWILEKTSIATKEF